MYKDPRERRRKQRKNTIFIAFAMVGLAILAVLAVLYLDLGEFADKFKNINYTYPSEIAPIRDKLNLTDRGDTIFAASRPTLEDSDQFNQDCESYNDQISILGCYTRDTIFLYNIEVTPELDGIIESTSAHELLHAAWARLNDKEKSELSPVLEDVYNSNQDLLSSGLDTYATENRLDELHSRIGTQVANLPGILETHYAKYFNDQDVIVALYNHYSAPFNELRDKQSSLATQLTNLKAQIDSETEDYTTRQNALSDQISEFNNCASTAGCFATSASFNQRRAELVAAQAELSNLYNEIDNMINQYNTIVTEYNDSVFRTEKLENTINSNATAEEITDDN